MIWLKRLLVFAVVLALCLALLLPPLIGWLSRDWLQGEVDRLAEQGNNIELVALSGGWMSSAARLRLASGQSRSDLRLSWQHGPVITRPDWALGWLQLHSEGALHPGDGGLISLSADGRLGLGLGLQVSAQLQAGQPTSALLQQGNVAVELVAGLTEEFVKLQIEGRQLRATALGVHAAEAMTMSLDWQGNDTQAGNGDWQLLLTDGDVTLPQGRTEVQSLDMQSSWQTDTEGLTDWHLQGRSLGLQSREQTYPSAAINLAGEDFHIPATLGALQLFLQLQQNSSASSAQQLWWAVLISEIPQVVRSRPSVTLQSLEAITPWGSLDAQFQFDLDEASDRQLQQPMVLDEAIRLRGEISLPRPLLESAVTTWQNKRNPKAPHWPPAYSERLVQQWLSEGLWQSRGERLLVTHFDYARGGLLLNEVPLLDQP